ncbi:MAG TPA: isochorismatase family cysteine hydrolase [Candidatus Angelobacter sp.]|nr:isochorismatase family cysteine hydrolase [Candidatus Angelobacter sp.]
MQILRDAKERCDPKVAALLIVDVQNDFCSSEGASARRGQDVSAAQGMVLRLQHLLEEARAVSLPIIFIKTEHSEWTDTPPWIYRKSQQKQLNTCRQGTWGADFYGVAPLPGERVVIKHRYSAFINTDLNTVLKARDVESVLVTGVSTNVCVETTARDAYMYDYYVTLVEDCSAAYSEAMHKGTLKNISDHFGLVVTSDEIIRLWKEMRGTKAVA